jgi:3-hydroxyisobutyrate dehydrogenase
MGSEMASNLISAGFAVQGYDISPAALDAFVQRGGRGVDTPAQAVRDAHLLIIVVHTAEQVDSVLFAEGGAVQILPQGATVVLHSTASPLYVSALAHRLISTKHLLLDAPVSGGTSGASAGTLVIMSSGPPAAFAAAQPALAAMASKVYRFGDAPGAGSLVKMINQLLVGVHIAVAAEAIALAAHVGVNLAALIEIVSGGVANSSMFATRAPRMFENDYASLRSAVDNFAKDLGIVLDIGKTHRFPLPIAAAAHQQFLAAAAAGFGQLDDAAVVKVYERLTGVDVAVAARSVDASTS